MAGRNNLLGFFLLALLGMCAQAAEMDAGSSVVLVYNSSMPASKEVADHYATQRHVPKEQIFAFPLPEVETISRDEFAEKLQQPLWNELRNRKLLTYSTAESGTSAGFKSRVAEARVRYVVLCYGVPLKITPDAGIKESVENLPQELRRNEAAVESELAILPLLDQKLPLAGLLNNPVGLATNRFAISPTNGILMVSRLDGPTPEIAKSLIDKAIQAEKEGLWGNAYFDTRSITNAGFKQADDMFIAAAELARLYGFEVIKETSSRTFSPATPLSDIAFYFGWYDQSVSGPFTNGMAQFRPGAVAYHLHSFSARNLRVRDLWWTGPLLAAGATATMGFTEEPYLQTTPQINAFVYRFVQLGFSFGEAAYASIPSLSWQTAVIGDPLYRPFEKSQKERHHELETSKSKDIEWSTLMWINFRLAQNAPLDEILQFYKTNPSTDESALLQEKLGDVYKSKGKVIDCLTPYSKALKLTIGPLQKLRVSLKIAPLLSAMGRAEQAYAIYQDLLRDYPDYPGKRDLYERLARVATTLKKKEEAAEFERLAGAQPQG
jgi:uncharacterized protein (TIGR03790 family)